MYGSVPKLPIASPHTDLPRSQTSSKPFKVKPQPEPGYIYLYSEDGWFPSYSPPSLAVLTVGQTWCTSAGASAATRWTSPSWT